MDWDWEFASVWKLWLQLGAAIQAIVTGGGTQSR